MSSSRISSDVISVTDKDFGAVGDGVTDCTVAFQAALDAAAGKTLFIPAGTFIVSPTTTLWLRVSSGTTIIGTGPASIVKVKANAGDYEAIFSGNPVPETNTTDVVYTNFRIDQNVAANTSCDIRPGVNTQSQVAILHFSCNRITVSDIWFYDCCGVNTVDLNDSLATDIVVKNNHFRFVKGRTLIGSGVYDNSAIYVEALNQEITGNQGTTSSIANRAYALIECHRGRAVVANNQSTNYDCVVRVICQFDGTQVAENDISVTGNIASLCGHGINLWSKTGYVLRNVSVVGNTLGVHNSDWADNSTHGIALNHIADGTMDGDFDNITITGNAITMQADSRSAGVTYSECAGILLLCRGNIYNLVCSGNTIRNSPCIGINLNSDNGIAQGIQLTDNLIVDSGNNANGGGNRCGIIVSGVVKDAQITGNNILGVNATGFGSINCQPTGASARVIVKDNAIFSALTTYQLVINANVQWDNTSALTYGTAIFPGDLSGPVRRFVITITDNVNFTINAPFYVVPGQRIAFTLKNGSGGALSSTITWPASFKIGTWTHAANGFSRSVEFVYDGTNYIELNRTSVDVPN